MDAKISREALYYPQAAVEVRRDRSVQCSIDVKNTGNVIIPQNLAIIGYYYASSLSEIGGRTCEDMTSVWTGEEYFWFWAANEEDIAVGRSYPYTFTTDAIDLQLGLNDAGLVLMLDTDGDGTADMWPDCLLKKDAFEVVEVARWGASLGTPTFSEV